MVAVAGVKRAHALAMAAAGALVLLLWARLPPTRVEDIASERTQLVSVVTVEKEPAMPVSTDALVDRTNHSVVEVKPAPAVAPAAPRAKTPSSSIVMTGDVYVSGHSKPHPEICPSLGQRVRLLILVASAPAHSAAREAIRLTWGHFARRTDVAFAFVLGASPPDVATAIDKEDALYGDIIVGNSIDSYSNLTLKTLSMLEWADSYCPRAKRMLKTDDDMFINVPRLLHFAGHPSRVNATKTIWGKVRRKTLPVRTAKSKYYMSPAQFPNRVLPDFATGPAYLLTTDIIRPLLMAAPTQPYVRLEDVFVTGVLATKLGIRRQHSPEFYNMKMASSPCIVQRGIAIHMVRYHEQFDLWRKLLDGRTKCS